MQQQQDKVLDVNREQLYEQGVGKDGQPLPPYSAGYAKIKQKQRGKSIVDIFRSGKLYKEMELIVTGDEYTITSKVSYSPYVQNARPTIYGFDTDGKKAVWHIIKPDFVQGMKRDLQLI